MLRLIRRLRHGPLRFFGPVWVLLGGLFRRATARSGLTIRQYIGPYGPFSLDGKFAFSNFEQWGGGHNNAFISCIEACRGKACVIDVGAHIGLVTLPVASALAPGGRVDAFEPADANRYLLELHVRLNGFQDRVVVVGDLVGADDVDEVPFFAMNDATGMNTLVPGAMGPEYRAVLRRQVTLDAYCAANHLSPDVIKIDVEGAELDVLRGARGVLSRCRPTVFLSVHPRQITLLGESVEVLANLIDLLGYDCRHADGTEVAEFGLREYILTPR